MTKARTLADMISDGVIGTTELADDVITPVKLDETGSYQMAQLNVSSASPNIDVTDAGTSHASQDFLTNSNAVRATIGVERSSGGGLFVGSSAYAAVFGTASSGSTQLATNNNVRMTIDDSGNVGIGTDSPTQKLHVYGATPQILLDTSDSRGEAWSVRSTNGASNNSGTLSFRDEAGNNWFDLAQNSGSPITRFYSGAASERMVIKNDGNVGIGTVNPPQKLVLSGATSDVAVLWNSVDTAYYNFGIQKSGSLVKMGEWGNDGASPYANILNIEMASDRVGINTTTPIAALDVDYGTNGGYEGATSVPSVAINQTDTYRGLAVRSVGSSNVPATLSLERTQGSGNQTSSGDEIGRIMFNGSGGSYVNRIGAQILAKQQGGYVGGNIPARLEFKTTATSENHYGVTNVGHATRFRINPVGDQLINGAYNFTVVSGNADPSVAFSYDFYRGTYGHPMKITCAISHWSGSYMSFTEGWYWGFNTQMNSNVTTSYNGGNGSWTISFPTNNVVRVRMNGDASYNYDSGWFIKIEGNMRRGETSAT